MASARRIAAVGVAGFMATVGISAAPAQAATAYTDFDSTVKLYNCSGSVVRLAGSSESDKALVLTNGHCLPSGHLDGNQVVVGSRWDRDYSDAWIMAGGEGKAREVRKIRLETVEYATMRSTDIALVSTNVTYRALRLAGVKVRTLAAEQPQVGTPVNVPSTYWGSANNGCGIDAVIPVLREGVWTWENAMRLNGEKCNNLRPGASGSPMVNANTGEVVGVLNTVQAATGDCSVNNPCEDGKAAPQGTSYGQQTWQVNACFSKGKFSPSDACGLPRP